MPKHLTNGRRRALVYTTEPILHSGAIVEEPFWEGFDLALGVVRGEVEQICSWKLQDIAPRRSSAISTEGTLRRVSSAGELELIPMLKAGSDYLTFEATITDPSQELFKGSSGGLFIVGERPVGMLVEAISPTTGRFIRMEEIHMNIARRLNRRSSFVVEPSPAQIPQKAHVESAFALHRAALPPLYPDMGPENVSNPGAYVFNLTKPNTIMFKSPEGTSALSRVEIWSDPDADYELPKEVSVHVASDADGRRRRWFGAGQLGLDGRLEISRLATNALWVIITINNGWDDGAIGIEHITLE